jgi:hypothetical protein
MFKSKLNFMKFKPIVTITKPWLVIAVAGKAITDVIVKKNYVVGNKKPATGTVWKHITNLSNALNVSMSFY